MKSLLIILFSFFCCLSFGQEKHYAYYIHLSDYNTAPQFEREENGNLKYAGNDALLKSFFSKYEVLEFHQAFPEYVKSLKILNTFFVETVNKDMVERMLAEFPALFLSYDDLTEMKFEELYYPDDYGTTSPNPNSGADASRKELDYLKAPAAWDITRGDADIIIGISDTAIDTTAADLNNGKVRFVSGCNSCFTVSASHGTSVAELAAGRGNNAHGSVGVCMDCNMLSAYLGGYSLEPPYGNLYKLASEGARVINMSWGSYTNNYSSGFNQTHQDVINYLVDEFGVVFVGAAGNRTSYSTPTSFNSLEDGNGNPTGVPSSPFGKLYIFPASYDNVISVSSINHKYSTMSEAYCCTSPWFPVYVNLEDSVGMSIDGTNVNNPIGVARNGYYINQYNPDGLQWMHTLNEKVDILATGYEIFTYQNYLTEGSLYTNGTSYSAPIVSGTIGLMLSVDECLNGKEVESILKLSTKDIEHMPLNQNFFGWVGAGKLEIYDSVNFVKQMKSTTGTSIIDNHIFYRDNFELKRINNRLVISFVTFKESAVADFTARNIIEVLANSDLNPNSDGFIDLKVDSEIDVTCMLGRPAGLTQKSGNVDKQLEKSPTKLYPNPNNGAFEIAVSEQLKGNLNVEVYDIYGKVIYTHTYDNNTFTVNIPDLSSGMYIVRLSYNDISETIKFIKE